MENLKAAVTIFFVAAAMAFPVQTAYAEGKVNMGDIREVKISEDGNWFKEGGMNRYDGTTITSTQEGQEMEVRLRSENYIEINDLTPEQYEAFVTNDKTAWWFEE